MKLELKDINTKLQPFLRFAKRYTIFALILIMLCIVGFFVLRINQFSRIEPNEDSVNEKLQTVQRPKIDQTVVDKIQQLQGQNVQVQSLFDQARNNPFNE